MSLSSLSHMHTYILHVIICIVHTDTLIQGSSIDPYVDNPATFRGASDNDVLDSFDVSMGFTSPPKMGHYFTNNLIHISRHQISSIDLTETYFFFFCFTGIFMFARKVYSKDIIVYIKLTH